MLIKIAVWNRGLKHGYNLIEYSEESIFTLHLFLLDGLPLISYFEFLVNNEHKFTGNIASLKKEGNHVIITLIDDFFSEIVPFTTTILNLKTIMIEWNKLEAMQVDKIKLILTEDKVQLSGI